MSADKHIKNYYFKYIFSKIEKDLYEKGYSIDIVKAITFVNYIKNSQNYLRDIYLISRIENLEALGKYLLFILKKAETGQINFENLTRNAEVDTDYIIPVLTSFFKSDKPALERKKWKEIKDDIEIRIEPIEEKSDSKEEYRNIEIPDDKKFKIEELDNELVTEEFIDKDIEEIEATQKLKEEDYEIKKGGYLELIKSEEEQGKKAFVLPEEESAEEKEIEIKKEGEENPESAREETEEITAEEIKQKEESVFSFDDLESKQEPEKEIIPKDKKKHKKDRQKEKKEIIKVPPPTEVTEKNIPKEEIKQKEKRVFIDQLSFIDEPVAETEKPEKGKREEELLSAAAEVQVNKEYLEYESELITRDALLNTDFEELSHLLNVPESEDRKSLIINSVIENSSFMKENSSRMSFEIITTIYGIIKLAFQSEKRKEFDINIENIEVFKNSLLLIESLIKGDNFEGYDKVIQEVEKIKSDILERKKQKENLEKIEKDKIELEKFLSTKYTDTTQREKLILLKQYILEVENIFKSLNEIKGEFQIYQALKKLSSTFVRFKEMVNISRILNIKKLAQLAEASYIFVKFLQNYRLDPYDDEVREIFKFIVYNFKLIFLDKPTKDLDVFITILNDPVQLFSKSKRKKKDE